MERPVGVAERVAQFGRVGSWDGQVLGKIASKMIMVIMLFSQVLRGGRESLTRRNEHTSAVETKGRGMEPAMPGQDNGSNNFYLTESE